MNGRIRCDGVNRRDLMRIGGLSALGLWLGDYFRIRNAAAAESRRVAKAKSCILVWLDGGPSHLETFDPKPDAPVEVRGPLESIATGVTGVRVSECLEQTAKVVDRLAILRSITSPLGEHSFGTHYLMTGYQPSPVLKYPTFGATLAHLRENSGVLPPNIAVPDFSGNVSANGFLPRTTSPFAVGGDPGRSDFKVRDLDLYQGLDLTRLDRRRNIVRTLNNFERKQTANAHAADDPDLERAYNLIASTKAKQAFNLAEESDAIRDRYGRGRGSSIGQSCLLARRLVERGVPFVTVNNSGWDTHQNILRLKARYPTDRNAHLPALDRAISALIGDLADRGLLDETLIVVMGEFGRTPKINSVGGRDHWPNVFSVVMAGGGVRGGQIVGSSDALGELPRDNPVTPADLAATIYSLLGIDPAQELLTSDGRPVRVVSDGAKVISEVLG